MSVTEKSWLSKIADLSCEIHPSNQSQVSSAPKESKISMTAEEKIKMQALNLNNIASNEVIAIGVYELLCGAFGRVKDLAVLGFDVVFGSQVLIQELADKELRGPEWLKKMRTDARDRLVKMSQGVAHLANVACEHQFDKELLHSLIIYEGLTSIDQTAKIEEVRTRMKERANAFKEPFKAEWEKFKELPPMEKYRHTMRFVGGLLADAYFVFGHKWLTNKIKFGIFETPPKFANTEFRDLSEKFIKGMTHQQVKEALHGAINSFGFTGNEQCIFVIFENQGMPVIEFAPLGKCTHADLARRMNGVVPEIWAAGVVRWSIVKNSLKAVRIEVNHTGHFLTHGTHMKKFVKHVFRENGFNEVKFDILQYYQTDFSFNPARGYIKGYSKLTDLPNEGEWWGVWLEHAEIGIQEFKMAPLTEIWNGVRREISVAELSVDSNGKMVRVLKFCKLTNFQGNYKYSPLTIIEKGLGHNILKGGIIYNPPIFPTEVESAWRLAIANASAGERSLQISSNLLGDPNPLEPKINEISKFVLEGHANPPKIQDAYKFISENHPTILVIPPKPNFEVNLQASQIQNGFTAGISITNDLNLANTWNEQMSRMSRLNDLTLQLFCSQSDRAFSEMALVGAKSAQEKAIAIFKEFEKFCKDQPSADVFQKKYDEFAKSLCDNNNHFKKMTAINANHPEIKKLEYWYHVFYKELICYSVEYKYFALIKQNQFVDAQNLLEHVKTCGENYEQLTHMLQVIQNISTKHYEKTGKNLFQELQNEKTQTGSEESLATPSYHQKVFSTLAKEKISLDEEPPEQGYRINLKQKYLEPYACNQEELKKYCGLNESFWSSRENYQKINTFLNQLNGKELAALDPVQVNDFFKYVNDSHLYNPNNSQDQAKTGDEFQRSLQEFKENYEFQKAISVEKNVISLLQLLNYKNDPIKYDIVLKRIGGLIKDLCLAGQKETAEQYLQFIKDGLPGDERLQKLQEKLSSQFEKLSPDYERCIFIFDNLLNKNKLLEKTSEKGDPTFHDLLKIALSACEINLQQNSQDFKNKINQVLHDIATLSNKEIQNCLLPALISKLLSSNLYQSSQLATIQEVLSVANPLFQAHPALHKALACCADSYLAYSKGNINEALRILNTNYDKESRVHIESAYDEFLINALAKLDKKTFNTILGETGLKQCNPEKSKAYKETLKPVDAFLSAKSQFAAFHELETQCVDKSIIIPAYTEAAKSADEDIERRTRVTKNPFLRTAFCAALQQRVDFFSSIEGSAASAINCILNDDHLPLELRKWGRRVMIAHNIHPEIVGQTMLYLSNSDPLARQNLLETYKERFSSTSMIQAVIGALNQTDWFKSESLETLERTLNIFNFFYRKNYINVSSLYSFIGPTLLSTFEEEMRTRFGIIPDNDFIHFMHSPYAQQVLNLYNAFQVPDPTVSCYMGLIALGSLAVGFAGMFRDDGWGESVSLTRIRNARKYIKMGQTIEADNALQTVKQKHLIPVNNKAQFIFAKAKVLLQQNSPEVAIQQLDLQFIRTVTNMKLRNSLADLRAQTLLNTSPSDIKNINHSIALLDKSNRKSNTLALQSLEKLSKINGYLLTATHFKFLEEQIQAELQKIGISHSMIVPVEIFRQGMNFLMDTGKEIGLLSLRMPFILAKLYLHHSEIEVRNALEEELRMLSQMNSRMRESLIELYGSLKSLRFNPTAIANKLLEFTFHATPQTLKVLMSVYHQLDKMTRLPFPNQNQLNNRPASITRFAIDLKKIETSLETRQLKEQKQLIEFFDAVSFTSAHFFPDFSKALDLFLELRQTEGKSWWIARDQIINMTLLENQEDNCNPYNCNPFEKAWRTSNPKRLKAMQRMRVELLSDSTDTSRLLFPLNMLEKQLCGQLKDKELLNYIKTHYSDQYHLVKSLFKNELKSLPPHIDLLDVYELGLVAFALALAKYDKSNHTESYYCLEIALECGFKPDFIKYFALALFKTTNHLDLIIIHRCLNHFKFKEWSKHKQFNLLQVIIASEKQNHAPRSSQELYRFLSQKIRSLIGSPELDNKLKKLVVSYKREDYGTYQENGIRELLVKGANPDQLLSQQLSKEYLLHKLAKIEFANIIHLFCEYGADVHVLNVDGMNALESFFASRMEYSYGNAFVPQMLLLAGLDINKTQAKKRPWGVSLVLGSLKNSETSFAGYTAGEIIQYKGFKRAEDIISATKGHRFYLYNSQDWHSPYATEP